MAHNINDQTHCLKIHRVGPQSYSGGWTASRLWDFIICCCVMTMVTRTGWSKIHQANCKLLIVDKSDTFRQSFEWWGSGEGSALFHSEATLNKLPVDQTHNGCSLEKAPEFERPCSGAVRPETPSLLVKWAAPGIRRWGEPGGVRSQEVTWAQEIGRLGVRGQEKTEDANNISSCRAQGNIEWALKGGRLTQLRIFGSDSQGVTLSIRYKVFYSSQS